MKFYLGISGKRKPTGGNSAEDSAAPAPRTATKRPGPDPDDAAGDIQITTRSTLVVKHCLNCIQDVQPRHTTFIKIVISVATVACIGTAIWLASYSAELEMIIFMYEDAGMFSAFLSAMVGTMMDMSPEEAMEGIHAEKQIVDAAMLVFIGLIVAVPVAVYFGIKKSCPKCGAANWRN